MNKTNYEARSERIDRLRATTQDRFLARQERLEKKAAPMIGEICRAGREIYYCWPVGGKKIESASHTEVVDYLIRNKYVQ
jgi:hypothetical protein